MAHFIAISDTKGPFFRISDDTMLSKRVIPSIHAPRFKGFPEFMEHIHGHGRPSFPSRKRPNILPVIES